MRFLQEFEILKTLVGCRARGEEICPTKNNSLVLWLKLFSCRGILIPRRGILIPRRGILFSRRGNYFLECTPT
jgi:hypothetical protein